MRVVLTSMVALVAVGGAARTAAAWTTERVSVGATGKQANGDSFIPSVSAEGRRVAFVSFATNLVPGDTNGSSDVFVRDRRAGTTKRVSVGAGGAQANSESSFPSISGDGRLVAFASPATNLVPGDSNGAEDVFVRDLQAGMTRRVSVGAGGAQASGGGRLVAFQSEAANLVPGDTNRTTDVFVRDRQTGTTSRVSVGLQGAQANGFFSDSASISADGRFVAFVSDATNLVAGDTNGRVDVFVRDRQAGTTRRVSVGATGKQANGDSNWSFPSISADGRFVTFVSDASNLVPGDSNGSLDAFVRDRQAGTTRRVSVASDGTQANSGSVSPSISADGHLVAFSSDASNLVAGDTNSAFDVFVRPR